MRAFDRCDIRVDTAGAEGAPRILEVHFLLLASKASYDGHNNIPIEQSARLLFVLTNTHEVQL